MYVRERIIRIILKRKWRKGKMVMLNIDFKVGTRKDTFVHTGQRIRFFRVYVQNLFT